MKKHLDIFIGSISHSTPRTIALLVVMTIVGIGINMLVKPVASPSSQRISDAQCGVPICSGGFCTYVPCGPTGAIPTPIDTPIPTAIPTAAPSITENPSPTVSTAPTNSGVALTLNIALPGIGSTSDNGVNANPVRKTRTFTIQLINASGAVAGEVQAPLTFTSGSYTGAATFPSVAPGSYIVKARSDNSLFKAVPGARQLTSAPTVLPQIILVTGNVDDTTDSKNLLDILDYNGLLSCYGGASCTDAIKMLSDLNDDGAIDSKDLNILFRGFATRKGD